MDLCPSNGCGFAVGQYFRLVRLLHSLLCVYVQQVDVNRSKQVEFRSYWRSVSIIRRFGSPKVYTATCIFTNPHPNREEM